MTEQTRDPLGYRLEPLQPVKPGMIATACVISCRVSGEFLDGMGGGGGDYISPAVRAWLLGPEGKAAWADHQRTARAVAELDSAADGLAGGGEAPGAGSAK